RNGRVVTMAAPTSCFASGARRLPAALALLAALALGSPAAAAVELARDGQARCAIVLPARPSAPEKLAAAELAAYLGRITGASFTVRPAGKLPAHAIMLAREAA